MSVACTLLSAHCSNVSTVCFLLLAINCQIPANVCSLLPAINCLLSVSFWQTLLSADGCLLSAAWCLLLAACCPRPAACFMLSAAYCLLTAVYCLLSAACCLQPSFCCLLSATGCLLPAVCGLLPDVCCLLSAAFCLLPVVCCLLTIIPVYPCCLAVGWLPTACLTDLERLLALLLLFLSFYSLPFNYSFHLPLLFLLCPNSSDYFSFFFQPLISFYPSSPFSAFFSTVCPFNPNYF